MLERLDEEIKRRTRVARIFPNPDSCLRLTASVLWGIEGFDSGYDQPGFGRRQGRPPVVSRAQYDVESLDSLLLHPARREVSPRNPE